MSDIWIVLVEDRHTDVEALPFTSEVAALRAAETEAAGYAHDAADIREAELTQRMLDEGWVRLIEYGPEGDCVRVVKRELDKVTG